jgi:hypothetical protein
MQSMMNRRSLLLKDGKIPAPGFICLVIIAGILIAGLWPFNFIPTNKVEWTGNRNGLAFTDRGLSIVRAAEYARTASRENPPRSDLVQPHQESSRGDVHSHLFDSHTSFHLLPVEDVPSSGPSAGDSGNASKSIAGALEKDKSHLITVTSRKNHRHLLDGI